MAASAVAKISPDVFTVINRGGKKTVTISVPGIVFVYIFDLNCATSKQFNPVYARIAAAPQLAGRCTFTCIHNSRQLGEKFGGTAAAISNTPTLIAYNAGNPYAKYKNGFAENLVGEFIKEIINKITEDQRQAQSVQASSIGRGSVGGGGSGGSGLTATQRIQQQLQQPSRQQTLLQQIQDDPHRMLTPDVVMYTSPWEVSATGGLDYSSSATGKR